MKSFVILLFAPFLFTFHDKVSTTYLLVEFESQPAGEALKSSGRNGFIKNDTKDPPFDRIHYQRRGTL